MVPLWFRSFWHQDRLSAAVRGEEFHAVTSMGTLTFLWHSNLELTEPGLHVNSLPVPGDRLPPDYLLSVWLFSKGREITETDIGPITYRHVVMPSWVSALVFSVFPVTWLGRLRRLRRRIRLDLCTSCGYALRTTPGRCPECGAVPTNKEP